MMTYLIFGVVLLLLFAFQPMLGIGLVLAFVLYHTAPLALVILMALLSLSLFLTTTTGE
ncbi:hypothetical protein D5125_17035 [Magnetovirga frankeli]|uniref:hypothetical protein n=1 Tax=Magnetovirga frankeli TaxID=947516 RepID=UPI00129313D2|nr:hypothetical protein D5125_17035 [gamma proteobacterium SS-5]